MPTRALLTASAMSLALSLGAIAVIDSQQSPAIAEPSDKPANKAEAQAAADMRMVDEYIDLGEYKTARDSLEKTLGALTAAGSGVRPIAATTHAYLGSLYIVGFKDTAKATEHFTKAIQIQKDIALPAFADERAKVVFAKAYEEQHPTIKCDTLLGVFHQSVALAQEGTNAVIEAKLDKHLVDSQMLVLYRGAQGGEFQEVPMSKVEGCTFRGEIPASIVAAPKVEYYLEARLKDGRPAARRGKAKAPYVMNVSFGPVADAPEPSQVSEPEVAETNEEPKRDEVEELLLKRPKESKGSGCAGCASGQGTRGGWLWGLFVLVVWRRRRRA